MEAAAEVWAAGPGTLGGEDISRPPDPVKTPPPDSCPPPAEIAAEEPLPSVLVLCPFSAHTVAVTVMVTVGVIRGEAFRLVVTVDVIVTVTGGTDIVFCTVTVEVGGQLHAADGVSIGPAVC